MSFQYHAPGSIEEAVELGARFGEDGRYLAGGTDLIVQWRRGKITPRHLVSLGRVPGLDHATANGTVTLGARVTHRSIERAPEFKGPLSALAESAVVVGGHQIRNVATVGGNIVNASPAADVVPVLLALDARVALRSAGGERAVDLDDFLGGPAGDGAPPGRAADGGELPRAAAALGHRVPEGRPPPRHGDLGGVRRGAPHARRGRPLSPRAHRPRRRGAADHPRARGRARAGGPRPRRRRSWSRPDAPPPRSAGRSATCALPSGTAAT